MVFSLICIFLVFLANDTIFKRQIKIFFAHESKKKMPLKVAYFTAQSKFFSIANLPKTCLNLIWGLSGVDSGGAGGARASP